MKLDLNDRKLQLTGLAGLMVYCAVVLKNGGEQIGMKDSFLSSVVGRLLFIAGWGLMAFSFCPKMSMSLKCLLSYGGALCIVLAVLAMKSTFGLSEEQKKPFGMLFIASWLAVGSAVGMGKPMRSKQLGIVAVASVFSAMLMILPQQRKLCLVDGPGMGLFAITFIALALANSL